MRHRDRRRHTAIWWACHGVVFGFLLGWPVALLADGAAGWGEWSQPSTVMAVVTLIFAGGQMWQARVEDRRRIQKLEDTSVTKEAFESLSESMRDMSQKLDRLIEHR